MFDVYHKWLGIKPGRRPPTYYQLLGVESDENDPEVIEEAAIRQTTHLRAYQLGQYASECTRLLNEVGQARSTLLNAEKRKAYDAALAEKQVAGPREKAGRISGNAPRPAPARDFVDAEIAEDEEEQRTPRKGRRKIAEQKVTLDRTRFYVLIGAGVAVPPVVLMIVLLIVLWPRSTAPAVAKAEGNDPPPVVHAPKPAPPRPDPVVNIAKVEAPNANPEMKRPPKKGPKVIVPDEPEQVVEGPPFRYFLRYVSHLASAPDSSYFLAAGNLDIHVCNPKTGRKIKTMKLNLRPGTPAISAVAVSPDSRSVLLGGDKAARVMDIATGEVTLELVHPTGVHAVAYSSDGKYLLTGSGNFSGLDDSSVRLWDASTGMLVRRYDGLSRTAQAVAFTPDGAVVAAGSGEIGRWNKDTGKHTQLPSTKSPQMPLRFSPDGWYLMGRISVGPRRLPVFGVWNTDDGQLQREITVQAPSVEDGVWSPDGRTLLFGGGATQPPPAMKQPGVSILCDAQTGKEIERWSLHPNMMVGRVGFLADGKCGLSTAHDNNVMLWQLPQPPAAAAAK